MTDDSGVPAQPARSYRPLRQLCPTCTGKATVLVPRFGMSSDGTAGTVHVEQRCRDCGGDGWLEHGSVRLG